MQLIKILGRYNPSIDGLRGISIAFVLAYHFFPGYFPGGFIGVDIFFVISGYLITLSYIRKNFDETYTIWSFYKARAIRLFPSLFAVILIGQVLSWYLHSGEEFYQLNKSILFSLIFTQNWNVLLSSGYFNSDVLEKPFLHLWSLSVEEQFYLFFSILVIFMANKKKYFAIFSLGFFALSFAFNVYVSYQNSEEVYLSPITRGWEIFAGVLLAIGIKEKNWILEIIFKLKVTPIIAYTLLACSLFLMGRGGGYPGIYGVIPVIASILLIGVAAYTSQNLILSNKILVFIGLISYPLYLWHWMLYSFAENLFPYKSILMRFAVLAVSIFLAFITYRYIERPIKARRDKNYVIIILACAWLVLLGISFLSISKFIKPHKYESLANQILEVQFDKSYKAEWLDGVCFLHDGREIQNFFNCRNFESQIIKSGKNILIWGDSHAAQLYPGFKSVFTEDFISLRSISSCAPIIGDRNNTENCNSLNKEIFNEIKTSRVDIVILASRWGAHEWQKVVETLVELKKIRNIEILIVGPPVHWGRYLPRLMSQIIKYGAYTSLDDVPKYLSGYPSEKVSLVDSNMRKIAYQYRVKYFSLVELTCNQDGCLNRVGSEIDDLVSFDYDHLTPNASKKLVREYYEK